MTKVGKYARSITFEREISPTIYYFVGYKTTIKQLRAHISLLRRAGFRVVAFEYYKAVFSAGDPAVLLNVVDDIKRYVNEDKQGRQIAGVYGISLGSWIGANILVECDIKKGFFNTGAVSVVNALWNSSTLVHEKKAYTKNGYSRESLKRAYEKYDFSPATRERLKGKVMLVMSSRADEVMDYDEVVSNVKAWEDVLQGSYHFAVRRSTHIKTVVRNLFKLRQTITFFR